MTDNPGVLVLTDTSWAVWQPLIEVVRSLGKMPPKNLRRTTSAIVWRGQGGAKWRSILSERGLWWAARLAAATLSRPAPLAKQAPASRPSFRNAAPSKRSGETGTDSERPANPAMEMAP